MFLLKQVLPAVIVAMAAAAVFSLIAASCGRERPVRLAPFALGVGYLCGHVFITGWTPFPPVDTTNWLPYFAVGAAAVGAIADLMASKTARNVVFGLFCVGALRLLLESRFRYDWSAAQGWMCVACLAVVVVLLATTLRRIDRRASIALEHPVLSLILCAGTSGALILSGSLLLGQFATVLAGAVVGTFILTSRSRRSGEGIAPVFSLLLIALLLGGYFFAELPAISAVLLVTAPALALISAGIVSNAIWAFAARVTLVCIPVGVALFLAFRSSPPLDY